ncbi:MAG: HD domain-containing protein [Thermanaerothrix sp.]|nr:HD domain-containing protein [Thermanaerothrix sp.]
MKALCPAFTPLDTVPPVNPGVLDLLDSGTRAHSLRVMSLSLLLGEALGVRGDDLRLLGLSALLHDLGKVKVPDWVLNKNGPLSPVERSMIQVHPSAGAAILRAEGFCEAVVLGVLHHHERFDGRGYPEGLKGEEIPLFARIIGVADAFEAMTSHRPYRAAMGRREAVEEILHHRMDQFDPMVADVFAGVLGFAHLSDLCFDELPDSPNLPHGDLMHSVRTAEVH